MTTYPHRANFFSYLFKVILFGSSAGFIEYALCAFLGLTWEYPPFMEINLLDAVAASFLYLPFVFLLWSAVFLVHYLMQKLLLRRKKKAGKPEPFFIFLIVTLFTFIFNRHNVNFILSAMESTSSGQQLINMFSRYFGSTLLTLLAAGLAACVIVAYVIMAILKKSRLIRYDYALWAVSILISFLLLSGASDTSPAKAGTPVDSTKKNIIFIVSDALRFDRLGASGNSRIITPNLDRFSKDCIIFPRTFSHSSETSTAMRSIFTSLYPMQHRMSSVGEKLNSKAFTLARALQNEGYFTCAVMGNPERRRSLGLGFHCFEDVFTEGLPYYIEVNMNHSLLGRFIGDLFYKKSLRADKIAEKTLYFLKNNKRKPFFLYVHIMEPHTPYDAPEPYQKIYPAESYSPVMYEGCNNDITQTHHPPKISEAQKLHSLYDAGVQFMDANLGEILRALTRENLYENSMIIFTSDHGESLYMHNYYPEHARYLYDDSIHVPLFIKLPSPESRSKIDDSMIGHVDLFPTIRDYFDLNFENPYPIRGKSFVPFLGQNARTEIGKDPDEKLCLSSVCHRGHDKELHSCRTREWKYIYRPLNGNEELYDIKKDPEESSNLAYENNEKLAELRQEFQALFDESREQILKPTRTRIEQTEIDKLQALGYLQ